MGVCEQLHVLLSSLLSENNEITLEIEVSLDPKLFCSPQDDFWSEKVCISHCALLFAGIPPGFLCSYLTHLCDKVTAEKTGEYVIFFTSSCFNGKHPLLIWGNITFCFWALMTSGSSFSYEWWILSWCPHSFLTHWKENIGHVWSSAIYCRAGWWTSRSRKGPN